MTFAMSTEGDSVKSALSEANEKTATDTHTDSSQDSTDAKEALQEKPAENNISAEKDVEKPAKGDSTEGESDQESEASEKKVENLKQDEAKPEENDRKAENNTEAAKEEKETKSEEDDEEEEPDLPKKEEKESKETKDVKEPKEKDDKASTASEKEEEEDEAEEEEEESEKEDKKPKKKGVPLLDQPLQTTGKRERKNVQRFEEEVKEPAKIEHDSGTGTPLGEIPRIEASITRFKNDDLKLLHKLIFKTPGKSNMLKKNINKFNGFSFKKDSDEYKKRLETCSKFEIKHLKSMCEMLDLEKNGTKAVIAERILDFLLEPKDSGKPVGGGRPKRASAVRANNRGQRSNLKDDSSSDEEFKPGDASDGSDEKPRIVNKRKRGRAKKGSSEDEASLTAGSSDESDFQDVPKSKRRKSVTKATPKGKPKTPARARGRPSKPATPAPRKSGRERKPVRKHESSDEDEDERIDDGSSSEDEPLVKKKAKISEPPTDDEIKTYIKSILEGANLEEITMKTVCQRVYDNYPDFDLTARKNFIKSTVKSLIST